MKLPNAYAAAAIDPRAAGGLAACLVYRKDGEGGPLVDVRTSADARVLLGCLMDSAGTVHDWLEVWVQDVVGMRRALGADRALPNALLDERFAALMKAGERLDPAQIVRTGWEDGAPAVLVLDPVAGRVEEVTPPGGAGAWKLCRDEEALREAGLPGYATTVHRYACAKGTDGRKLFAAVSEGAPTTDRTLDPVGLSPASRVAINPGGGAIGVRRFAPMGVEEYLDAIAGEAWTGLSHGKSRLPAACFSEGVDARNEDGAVVCDGAVLSAQHGQAGRMLEGFYLRLRVLADAIESVRRATALTRRPLLNVRADSFRVKIGEPARGLPLAWTARTILVDQGDALEVEIPGSRAKLFTRLLTAGASVYWPDSAGGSIASGRGSVRIRRTLADGSGGVIVEGTLATSERLATAATDLMWLRLPLASGPLDVYASAESEAALAQGEWRFRTLGRALPAAVQEALKKGEGVPLRDVPFRVVPVMSSPCDLYSLGVLSVRALLVGRGNTLAMALDEVLSLARQVAMDFDPGVSAGLRIQALMDSDPRWVESLGPQRLGPEGMASADAFDVIPPELWRSMLELVVRMFPGIGPDSRCKDLGDAPPAGIHVVFDEFVAGMDALLMRTRSLMFLDWKYNREIGGLIRRRLMGAPAGV